MRLYMGRFVHGWQGRGLSLIHISGAGKGTNAEILSDKLNIPTISTGNILRAAVKDGTPMGLKRCV